MNQIGSQRYSVKNFNFELKKISQNGVFSGYASVFNVVDSQGDVVIPGAFRGCEHSKVKLLWQHNASEPIGKVLNITEDAKGLFVTAKLLLEINRAKDAYHLLKADAIQGLSIGYTIVKYTPSKSGKFRILKNINLWEISLVTFPSNSGATVTSVKSANTAMRVKRDIDRIIEYLHA